MALILMGSSAYALNGTFPLVILHSCMRRFASMLKADYLGVKRTVFSLLNLLTSFFNARRPRCLE